MQNNKVLLPLLIVCVAISGCDLAQGIFKAGFLIGLVIAAFVIVVLIKLFAGRGKSA